MTTRRTPLKICSNVNCCAPMPNATVNCPQCGTASRRTTGRALHHAIKVLMKHAEQSAHTRDPELHRAWEICFKKVHGYEPLSTDQERYANESR